MKLLFWNVNKKDLIELVLAIAIESDVDVIVLNECNHSADKTLASLRADVSKSFRHSNSVHENRFQLFYRDQSLISIEQLKSILMDAITVAERLGHISPQ